MYIFIILYIRFITFIKSEIKINICLKQSKCDMGESRWTWEWIIEAVGSAVRFDYMKTVICNFSECENHICLLFYTHDNLNRTKNR